MVKEDYFFLYYKGYVDISTKKASVFFYII